MTTKSNETLFPASGSLAQSDVKVGDTLIGVREGSQVIPGKRYTVSGLPSDTDMITTVDSDGRTNKCYTNRFKRVDVANTVRLLTGDFVQIVGTSTAFPEHTVLRITRDQNVGSAYVLAVPATNKLDDASATFVRAGLTNPVVFTPGAVTLFPATGHLTLEDVKDGDIVQAIESDSDRLTAGKSYTVLKPVDSWVRVVQDNGKENGFSPRRFKRVDGASASAETLFPQDRDLKPGDIKIGDTIEALSNHGGAYTKGKRYTVTQVDSTYVWFNLDSGRNDGFYPYSFKRVDGAAPASGAVTLFPVGRELRLSEIKVGDIVRATVTSPSYNYTKDRDYTVTRVTYDYLYFKQNDGAENGFRPLNFKRVDTVSVSKTLEVGAAVRIIGNKSGHGFTNGQIVYLISKDNSWSCSTTKGGGHRWYVLEDDMELVTEGSKAVETKSKVETGANRFMRKNNAGRVPGLPIPKGTRFRLTKRSQGVPSGAVLVLKHDDGTTNPEFTIEDRALWSSSDYGQNGKGYYAGLDFMTEVTEAKTEAKATFEIGAKVRITARAKSSHRLAVGEEVFIHATGGSSTHGVYWNVSKTKDAVRHDTQVYQCEMELIVTKTVGPKDFETGAKVKVIADTNSNGFQSGAEAYILARAGTSTNGDTLWSVSNTADGQHRSGVRSADMVRITGEADAGLLVEAAAIEQAKTIWLRENPSSTAVGESLTALAATLTARAQPVLVVEPTKVVPVILVALPLLALPTVTEASTALLAANKAGDTKAVASATIALESALKRAQS